MVIKQKEEMARCIQMLSNKLAAAVYKFILLGNMAYKCKLSIEELSLRTRNQVVLKYGSKKQKRPIRRKLKQLKRKIKNVITEEKTCKMQ